MALPTPPYTYDDPRLLYDEVCFFYDGGYDQVCLTTPKITVLPYRAGLATAPVRRRKEQKKEEDLPIINVFIQASLFEVNNAVVPDRNNLKYVRFSGANTPLEIKINKLTLETSFPYVTGEIVKTLQEKDSLKVSSTYLEKAPITQDNIELRIVEDFEDIRVSAAFVKEETKKEQEPAVNADIIKENNDK